jgi:hypothetical protein
MTSPSEDQEFPHYTKSENGESAFWLFLLYFAVGFIVSLLFWGIAKVPYWRLSFPLSFLLTIPWWLRRMHIERNSDRRHWYQDKINLGIFQPPALPLPESTSRGMIIRAALLIGTICVYVIAALVVHALGIHGGPR